MVSVFGSRASSLDLIPDWGHHVSSVLGQDTLLSQCLSALRCTKMGTGKFNVRE